MIRTRGCTRSNVGAIAASGAVACGLLLAGPLPSAASNIRPGTTNAATTAATCQLGPAGQIHHVVHIIFDNTHFTRDNPNVPSDLEQMPNLLNFIESNGTLLSSHHTPLIAHTATDMLTELSGVYPDQHGVGVSNSYRYFTPSGGSDAADSFGYWTAPVDDLDSTSPTDTTPNMLSATGVNAPAPWVPYTRAGCNLGAVGATNAVLENGGTDIPTVFGNPSPEYSQYLNDPNFYKDQENADYQGIALHCAAGSPVCSGAKGVRPDNLPAEPGGYSGFQALFGNKYVAPVISPSGPVADLNGNVINNPFTFSPGFPGFDGMSAPVSLGYTADMLEHGVPVTYSYLSDIHDDHSSGHTAFGPGQSGYEAALQSDNSAFGTFFSRLAADGINTSNTLFVFSSDEGDHFSGVQQTGCNGVTTPCTYGANQVGEIHTNITGLLATQKNDTTSYVMHNDTAPNFWVQGNPARDSSVARKLERDVAGLTATNPYTNANETITNSMADSVEMKVLHMVSADPARTPTFTMFAKPSYYLSNDGASCDDSPCISIDPSYAWMHGDVSPDINTTWLGVVGPGVKAQGVDSTTWSDHTDVRPTMLSLLGLRDDYRSSGRVLIEDLTSAAVPPAMAAAYATVVQLAQVYKQLEAPVGQFGSDTLKISTQALTSGSSSSDTTYANLENQLASLGSQRDQIGSQMSAILDGAAFSGTAVDQTQAQNLINQGNALLAQVHQLAGP